MRLVLLVVLGGLGFFLWKNWQSRPSGPVLAPAVTVSPPSAEELSSTLKSSVESVSEALSKIVDHTNVQEALGTIEEATSAVIAMKLDRLPESHKAVLTTQVKPMAIKMAGELKKLYKMPGVQATIEPAISPMLSRLQAFANVSAD
jgi:cytoskeletal protein RodZ